MKTYACISPQGLFLQKGGHMRKVLGDSQNSKCLLYTRYAYKLCIFISPKGKSWLLLWFAKALAYAISV